MTVDFIGIGGHRCGTTWLYEIMKEHPGINASAHKELHFFSYYYHYGFDWYHNNYFSTDKSIIGEFSTSYLYDYYAPFRVKAYNPDIKIIVSVRNPINRFISHHKHEVLGQRVSGSITDKNIIINNNPTFLNYGLYYSALSQWLNHFSKDQILVILFDEIVAEPESVASKVYNFLKVDSSFVPLCLHKIINSSWVAKSSLTLNAWKTVAEVSRKLGMGGIIDRLKKHGLKEKVDKMNTDDRVTIIDIDEDFENHLMEYFQEDVQNLSKFMGADLHKIWFE